MPFDPCNFLNLSRQLVDDSSYHDESKYRTSVSRAYYSAFLVSRTYLESKNYTLSPSGKAHKEVINYMAGINVLVRNMLYKLRQNRTTADYFLHIEVKKGHVNNSLICAEKVIEEVSNM
ncbi:HEPN domain-containing protein [Methanosarcina spelaei]|nr:HEPN domain-containing protein [Methanosarcina spelaei]